MAQPIPETPLRLYLRVGLKVAVLFGLAVALYAGLRYAGLGSGADDAPAVRRVAVDGWQPGEARRIGWSGDPIWILRRSPTTQDELGVGAWFVVFDRGSATGCSLLWERAAAEFREVCSDARYDAAGEPLGATNGGALASPDFQLDEQAQALELQP